MSNGSQPGPPSGPPSGPPPPGSAPMGSPVQGVTTFTIYLSLVRLGLVILFGLIGSFSSLLTFTSKKLRSISTSTFFIGIALTDILYILLLFYDFVVTGILRGVSDPNYVPFCRFRKFTNQTTGLVASWLLVLISIDRWARARFPTRSKLWCTQRHALIATGCVAIIAVGGNVHFLTPFFGNPNNKVFL